LTQPGRGATARVPYDVFGSSSPAARKSSSPEGLRITGMVYRGICWRPEKAERAEIRYRNELRVIKDSSQRMDDGDNEVW